MPRVPVIEERSVLPSGQVYPGASPAVVRVDRSGSEMLGGVTKALGSVGDAVEGVQRQDAAEAERLKREAAAAKRDADAVATANGMLELDARASKTSEGFLRLRGLEASGASQEAFDSFEKDRQEIAERLGTPEARADFLVRSAPSVMAYRRKTEAHVGREFEAAREETLKARVGQALGQASAGVPDLDSWEALTRSVVEDLRNASRTPAEADARVAAFTSDAGTALVSSLVADGRVAEAAAFVDENRAKLGGHYDNAKALVAKGLAGAQRDDEAAAVDEWAALTVESVRRPSGYVDGAAAKRHLANVPQDKWAVARKALDARLDLEGEKKKADLDKLRGVALAIDNTRRPLPGLLVEKLNDPLDGDPKFLSGLLSDQDIRWRRLRAEREGPVEDAAAARREQAMANRTALNDFEALGKAGMAGTDVGRWAAGRGLDDEGRSRLDKAKTQAAESVQKGDAHAADALADLAEAKARPLVMRKGKRKGEARAGEEDSILNVRANAQREFDVFVKKEGRHPNEEEKAAIVGRLLLEPETGWFEPTRRRPGFEPPPPVPLRPKTFETLPTFPVSGGGGEARPPATPVPMPQGPVSGGDWGLDLMDVPVRMQDPRTGRTYNVPSSRVAEAQHTRGLKVVPGG